MQRNYFKSVFSNNKDIHAQIGYSGTIYTHATKANAKVLEYKYYLPEMPRITPMNGYFPRSGIVS